MSDISREYAEYVLRFLDENSYLFPQFALKKTNDELILLGSGGFSSVYEMYNKERPELPFTLKVTGFSKHTVSSEEFQKTSRVQWILGQESDYIVRILDTRELALKFDENGKVTDVRDVSKEIWEETDETLHLQFVLMEKLDRLIEKDRFGKATLLCRDLNSEDEVLKLALQIGQALAASHADNCLHRDIKLENIFRDPEEMVYKLGDFGVAKWAENGNAETVVYTDGYGAPEIERRFSESYDATADIYSLGITLYLLLNNLRFPGSDGYYAKSEVQYDPEFIFPAPARASEKMASIIRKMCSYDPKDRYQSMNEVLVELSSVTDRDEGEYSADLISLSDMVTETYREEKNDESDSDSGHHIKTRAERKKEQEIVDILYKEDSAKYFAVITVLMTLMIIGFRKDSTVALNWKFYILPAAVILEALFLRIKEFHLFFGTAILVFCVISIMLIGLTVPHIILILAVLSGRPVLTLSGGLSSGIWVVLAVTDTLKYLEFIGRWHMGWIFMIGLFLAVFGYYRMRYYWKNNYFTKGDEIPGNVELLDE
ncbi:Serine/threonine protein kinase [Lachnospiraceae bacterium XBB2008]|nr:Serine/threonine protein kinase [Lachnospiraceae bacterium XBB2008]